MGEQMLTVPHHHLLRTVTGIEATYTPKSKTRRQFSG